MNYGQAISFRAYEKGESIDLNNAPHGQLHDAMRGIDTVREYGRKKR